VSKPIRPQDVKKGMWLILTAIKQKQVQPDEQYGNLLQLQQQAQATDWYPSGIPIKVHGVSLPMIVCYSSLEPERICTVDLTRFEVRIPSRGYVSVFINHYKATAAASKLRGGVVIQNAWGFNGASNGQDT